MTVPKDLVTYREAATHCNVAVETVRQWARIGKGGVKLQTYRKPEMPHLALVSLYSAERFASASPHQRTRRHGKGVLSIKLSEEDADRLRELTGLLSKRLGVKLSKAEAMRMAISEKLRAEQ